MPAGKTDRSDARRAKAAADRAIERRGTLVLTARESEAFADAILSPAKPGPVLRRAVRAYRNKTVMP